MEKVGRITVMLSLAVSFPLVSMQLVEAFAPSTTTWCSPSRLASPYTFGTRSAAYSLVERFPKSPIAMAMDPHFFSSILLSDEATQAISTAVDSLVDTGAEIVPKAANNGWFGFLTVPIELLLQGIHAILVTLGAQQNSWGLSILGLTLLIKILTYPLTKSQLESTNKMQVRELIMFSFF
jgi:membrane protein insertase Oxa1/YidC/SpoIIIJ